MDCRFETAETRRYNLFPTHNTNTHAHFSSISREFSLINMTIHKTDIRANNIILYIPKCMCIASWIEFIRLTQLFNHYNRNKCAACFRQFNKVEHLVEHMRISYHSSHEPTCGICRKHCRSFESLREHLIGNY